jgi:hypothetical protein
MESNDMPSIDEIRAKIAQLSGLDAKQQKAVLIMSAVLDTSDAITRVLKTMPVHKKRIFPKYDRTPRRRLARKTIPYKIYQIAISAYLGAMQVNRIMVTPIKK